MVISGGVAPQIQQLKPIGLEIYRSETDIRPIAAGYAKVDKVADGIDARADIFFETNTVFHVLDHWNISNAVLSLKRKVDVSGEAPGGFCTSITLAVDPAVNWTNVNFLAPGIIYGDPAFNGERSAGGTQNYAARRFLFREDIMAAPLLAIFFPNGASISELDPAPRGETILADNSMSAPALTDARLQFGALGVQQASNGPIELSFCYPGQSCSVSMGFPGNRGGASVQPRWTRRYHPISAASKHSYQTSFRFGAKETFRDLERNAFRWAWAELNPPVHYIDVDLTRRVLLDHLAAMAKTNGARAGIPFAVSTTPTNTTQWNSDMIAMGFVSKNIECADQLLREGDRDKTERGQNMRRLGLGIINSMVQSLSDVPLKATGFDLSTGQPWDHIWLAPWLRNATEDMRVLLRASRRERAQGREHPEWLAWVKKYADWLVLQQRADGSFPRRWKTGSNEIAEPTSTTSYAPVPLLVLLTEETGDPKYQQAAIRAADFVWSTWGERGLFIGGASDTPNVTDKEAGMLSMEAFLSLYESTKEPKWLERAQAAANFAESWIWIWTVPMPLDTTDEHLHWKQGVPALGFQGITAMSPGGVDEYLDWAVPSYAKLFNLTKDPHYLDVARVLLHDTKAMVAMPGGLFDMRAPGFQQEGWGMGPGGARRGLGGHRFWLPWISANHLYGITGLEEYDPALYKTLCVKP